MKIACLSDTHEKHSKINEFPEADIFIFAGDFTNRGSLRSADQFNQWLGSLPYEHNIVICGNHEIGFDHKSKEEIQKILSNAIYLDQNFVEINGVKIWGEPRQPEFRNWAFNKKFDDMKNCWELIPDDIDILLTHGPPKDYGDRTSDGRNVGCVYLNQFIKKNKIPYIVCGHIHEARGQYNMYDSSVVLNVSAINNKDYSIIDNPIVVFEYDKQGQKQ